MHEEFVITDAGMTSETDKSIDKFTKLYSKQIYLMNLYITYKDKNAPFAKQILSQIKNTISMSENFMIFPLSSKRMIVLINPFFKFCNQLKKDKVKVMPLSNFTYLDNEKLFKPNKVNYVARQIDPFRHILSDNDKYIYKINRLSTKETKYVNCLFLDRIINIVGFSNLNKVKGSIIYYYEKNNQPRADYTKLVKIINDREK